MNKRAIGAAYETLALNFLQGKGVRLVERNFYCRQGEIDLICRDGKYLVFAEVKYRADARCGTAAESVDKRKRRRVCRAGVFYLKKHHYPAETPVRFDVVALDGDGSASTKIRWIRDAFPFDL